MILKELQKVEAEDQNKWAYVKFLFEWSFLIIYF
jgi:hypothetical protein